MRKDIVLLGLVGIIAACSSHSRNEDPARETSYFAIILEHDSYGNYLEPYVQEATVNIGSMTVSYDDRDILELQPCLDQSWHCIFDGLIQFSIPNNWSPRTARWNYEGQEYSIANNMRPFQWREYDDVYLIQRSIASSSEQVLGVYLFSQSGGLVGFSSRLEDSSGRIITALYLR